MAAMAQLAQTQQQMLQQKTSQRTRVDVAIYQEVKILTVFLKPLKLSCGYIEFNG